MQSKTNIAIGTLSLALLLVIVLYFQDASSFFSNSGIVFIPSNAVRFQGKIINAPKSGTASESFQEVETPVVSNSYLVNSSFNNSSLAAEGNTKMNPFRSNGTVHAVESRTLFSTENSYSNSINARQINGMDRIGSGRLFSSNTPTNSSEQYNNTSPFSSMAEDKMPVEINNRQSAGGVDPGGDPTDPPLPLGDGVWTLLFFAVGYFAWKFNKSPQTFKSES